MTIQDRLSEIEERAEKATPGPWVVDDKGQDVFNIELKQRVASSDPRWNYAPGKSSCFKNLNFISKARTDIPKLVKALRVSIEALEHYSQDVVVGGIAHMGPVTISSKVTKEALTEIERILNAEGEG